MKKTKHIKVLKLREFYIQKNPVMVTKFGERVQLYLIWYKDELIAVTEKKNLDLSSKEALYFNLCQLARRFNDKRATGQA